MIQVVNYHFTLLRNHNLTILKIMVTPVILTTQGFLSITNHNTIWFYLFTYKRRKLYSVILNGYKFFSQYSYNSQFFSILLAKQAQLTVFKMVTEKLKMVAYANQRRGQSGQA
jgi:hypothetical protein